MSNSSNGSLTGVSGFFTSQSPGLVGYGVDTLILNVRYADKHGQPLKQEFDEQLAATLDYLQSAARSAETAVASDWSFLSYARKRQKNAISPVWKNHLQSMTS